MHHKVPTQGYPRPVQKPHSWISRALTPLAKRIARVRSVQEVRRARDVLRIGIVFAFFILVPAMLLSLLALSTLRSEELFVDAEYRSRTDAMTEQLSSEVIQIFERFESATRTRLDRGESPLDHLGDLSPYLRQPGR